MAWMLEGVAASPGIVIGKAVVLKKAKVDVKPTAVDSSKVKKEISDFKKAIAMVKKDLQKLAITVGQRLDPEYSRIFEAQMMIADDQVINARVVELVKEKKLSAAYLYHQQVDEVIEQLSKSKDSYLRERTLDIDSVCTRFLNVLQGVKKAIVKDVEGPTIVIASNLSPGDLLGFSVRKKVGFAMEIGGVTSHTSLLAKSLNLPAVVGLGPGVGKVDTGDRIILDGFTGKLYVNPDQGILKDYHRRQRYLTGLNLQLSKLKSKPARTKDGYQVKIMGNIELPTETARVIKSGAEGIGLYRTEYLFLTDSAYPGIDKQFRVYKSILKKMGDEPVKIRTFDMGGDKFISRASRSVDPNPFLGWRAIRFCLDNPEIFKIQLKALLKASVHGKLEIMLPMISNLDELLETKRLIKECRNELAAENVMVKDNIPLGIMIEVPSAVLLAEHLAAEVDFFSLGTNDLIQYVMAVDRSNEQLAHLYQSLNPAVLMMIKQTIVAGHNHDIKVGICGEFAADPYGVILLVGLGVDEFSVNYQSTGLVKQVVCNIDRKLASETAEHACRLQTASQVKNYLRSQIKSHFPELLPLIEFIKGVAND